MTDELEIRCAMQDWGHGIGVNIRQGNQHVFTLETKTKEDCEPGPTTCTLSMTAAQKLIDSLWNCGLRPTEGTGSAGAMAAVQKHLEDMRSLVFKG